jgi:hypothetical protein
MNNHHHGKPDLIDKLIGRVGLEAEVERLRRWVRWQRVINLVLAALLVYAYFRRGEWF